MKNATRDWTPDGWRELAAAQQPTWPEPGAYDAALAELAAQPPLVFAGEARTLRASLGAVAAGEGFLLHAGDCAESFGEFSADKIRDQLKVILQMAAVLTYSSGVPVVKIGRIAGQMAKPRSSDTEIRDDIELPSYRGDMVNGFAFDPASRRPDPSRLTRAYNQSAATLNLLRAFAKGGFADLSQVHRWNLEFVGASPEGQRYEALAGEIDRALRFMRACGILLDDELRLHQTDIYTSHEALLLGYEEALTRRDSISGDWYDCSAHLVWVGERTRQIDDAHVEFVSGVANPIGVKIGPACSPQDALDLCTRLDPDAEPGRLMLICRMGRDRIRESLPPIIEAVEAAGHPVVWTCDPMHGNTFTNESGYKTRRLDDVLEELTGFFEVCRAASVWPGGVHVELTGDDVTECLGGGHEVLPDHLDRRYETLCDPRLNARQSLDLAFRLSELIRA